MTTIRTPVIPARVASCRDPDTSGVDVGVVTDRVPNHPRHLQLLRRTPVVPVQE